MIYNDLVRHEPPPLKNIDMPWSPGEIFEVHLRQAVDPRDKDAYVAMRARYTPIWAQMGVSSEEEFIGKIALFEMQRRDTLKYLDRTLSMHHTSSVKYLRAAYDADMWGQWAPGIVVIPNAREGEGESMQILEQVRRLPGPHPEVRYTIQ